MAFPLPDHISEDCVAKHETANQKLIKNDTQHYDNFPQALNHILRMHICLSNH